ncbi:MAG: glycosyltransferase family 4 protein [Planctomycetes bacterium]|nr:glycosyltransferase family 4 protein [Planctomycetota bacterium]
MHLGLYEEPVHTNGQTFDTYGPYARMVLALARHFDRVTVFAPTTDQATYFSGVPLDAPNLRVVPLPFFLTFPGAMRRAHRILGAFRRHAADLDVVIARNTAPLADMLWRLTRRRGAVFIYHFASDPFETIARSPKYRGPCRWFARTAYGVHFAIQKRIMRRGYSFVSGQALYERLRHITPCMEPLMESTLAEEDYHLRQDSCTGDAVKLLYVGRLHAGKGLPELLVATARLRERGCNVAVDLVGEGALGQPLAAQAAGLGLAGQVCFRGPALMGPELNAHYNGADVFVLPSASEGAPRVVLEALGHSLPVVATEVGNIPHLLGGGTRGALVPPGDPAALADGIERIIRDGKFRQQCIRDGYAFARQHSLEAMVAAMANKAKALVAERRGTTRNP